MQLTAKKKNIDSEKVLYRFEGDITVYTVKKLKSLLIREITAGHGIDLDLSGIAKFDSAGYQLLLLLKREAARLNKSCNVTARSGEVSRVLELYGMD